MFNEIINHKPNADLLRAIERDEKILLLSARKETRSSQLRILEDLQNELRLAVLPALDDIAFLGDLEDWLTEYIVPAAIFNVKEEPYRLEIGIRESLLSPELYLRYREIVAAELFDFFTQRGVGAVRRCQCCGGYFIWNRKDQKYCSRFCVSAAYRGRKPVNQSSRGEGRKRRTAKQLNRSQRRRV